MLRKRQRNGTVQAETEQRIMSGSAPVVTDVVERNLVRVFLLVTL